MRRTILLPGSVGVAVLLACLVALLAALASVPAASAASRDKGASFAARCDYSHRNSDDPIVYPGERGVAHSHDFFGNRSARFDSTYQGMLAASTTCTRTKDTAGYWFPTVRWTDQNGATTKLKATRAVFYYRAGGKDHTQVKPFVKDLRVITANTRWYCGSDDEKAGSQVPPTQCTGGVLGVRIIFPDCSDGQPDSADHRSHMARSRLQSDGARACPSTHPLPVPTLTVNANFQIPTTPGEVTLSSDHDAPGGSTMHADFWNTWNQAELERLVAECINKVPPTEPRPDGCRAPTATA